MYLQDIADIIKSKIPEGALPQEDDLSELFLIYAVLLRSKGTSVTNSDIHDAWSAWMKNKNGEHESLVPFESLSVQAQSQDHIYTKAVQEAAEELGNTSASSPSFTETLFPSGPPQDEKDVQEVLDLYKIMVDSSESLVNRRQAVNTFFLTMNGALLTASGIIVKSSGGESLASWGIVVIALAGAVLCLAWRSLINSFGQLNTGKFKVINAIERYFKASIYAAEWIALEEGKNPKVYRSFTSREIWVPNSLLVLHVLAAVASLAYSISISKADKPVPEIATSESIGIGASDDQRTIPSAKTQPPLPSPPAPTLHNAADISPASSP